jgi:hypothetical protein
VIEATAHRYAVKELLAAASAASTPASSRLITDWVSKGLLDQPLVRGLGRGKGTSATWSENQFQLFLLLLDKRRTVRLTATLCNIPVGLWLYFGPDYVPVRQVRRALGIFASNYATTSARAARQTGRFVAEQLAAPHVGRKDRERLIEAVVMATGGGGFDKPQHLLDVARDIFDPDRTGRTVGPPEASLTPEAWVRLMEARITAANRLDTIPDDLFADTRLANARTLQAYIRGQPRLRGDPQVGELFEPVTNDFLFNNACMHTLTTLGFLELARQAHSPNAHDIQAPPEQP